MSQGMVCHLLELFFTCVNHQQLPLLPHEIGLDWLMDRECPLSLVLALCSLSAGYSSHKRASQEHGSLLNERLASRCRLMLLKSGPGDRHLDHMLSLCALASYGAANGHGDQAWCDIGTVSPCRR